MLNGDKSSSLSVYQGSPYSISMCDKWSMRESKNVKNAKTHYYNFLQKIAISITQNGDFFSRFSEKSQFIVEEMHTIVIFITFFT